MEGDLINYWILAYVLFSSGDSLYRHNFRLAGTLMSSRIKSLSAQNASNGPAYLALKL